MSEIFHRCKKLPKGMKDWKAYEDLKKKIDDFTEVVPTLEAMTNKAMKERHWVRISDLTGFHFDMELDAKNLLLKDIMKAPILKFKDEIEVSYHCLNVSVFSMIVITVLVGYLYFGNKREGH